MKRSLLFFMIIFIGFSFSLSAEERFICHLGKDLDQTTYKTDAYNGKEVVYPLDNPNADLNTCPNTITVEDKDPQVGKHVLWLSCYGNKRCQYGTDNDLICMFTYVQE